MDICACVIEKLHISIVFLSSSSFRSLWSSAHGEEKVLPFSYTHHHYYPLSLSYIFLSSSFPCLDAKKRKLLHIILIIANWGFFLFDYLMLLLWWVCMCVLRRNNFYFLRKKISVFIKAVGMSLLESKNI